MSQALYRKYRPRDFDSMLGQDHIVETLKNQIVNENIGHAYLFSGTRGTGKTSTAKILSRAVNCLSPRDGNPCNQCDICKGISDGSIMDVVEMDAASNRGVNDIRELRDKVAYPPTYSKYKVYIIDEVHMLTKEAFNALLKTLEEPPVHLIFILATTEPERIPQTILSRCQRFDFKRITIDDIVQNMRQICDDLGVEIEEEALSVIAFNADGGMRDALSLLDQCISFSSGNISYEDAIDILGIVNKDVIFDIVDAIIEGDVNSLLINISDAIDEGRDIGQFIKDIINHIRDIMVIKTSNKLSEVLKMDPKVLEILDGQAERLELNYILRILSILTEIDEKARFSSNPRILMEMAFIRIVQEENISIEDRLSRLESGVVVNQAVEKKVEQAPRRSSPVSSKKRIGPEKPSPKREEAKRPSSEEVELTGEDISYEQIRGNWAEIIESIRQEKPNVSALLKDGDLQSVENNLITVVYKDGYEFHKNAINNENNKTYVEGVLKRIYRVEIRMKFVMEYDLEIGIKAPVEKNSEDMLKEAVDLFGEDKVEIK